MTPYTALDLLKAMQAANSDRAPINGGASGGDGERRRREPFLRRLTIAITWRRGRSCPPVRAC